MNYSNQEDFEKNIILETDLGFVGDSEGNYRKTQIEDLTYNKLSDIQLEKGEYLSDDDKKIRSILVWNRIKQLTEDEKTIAWLYYVEDKTLAEIANEIEIKTFNRGFGKKGECESSKGFRHRQGKSPESRRQNHSMTL